MTNVTVFVMQNICNTKIGVTNSGENGMTERLERALIAVARRYAPDLVPGGWQRAGDYRAPLAELNLALASNGALVLMGDLAPGATQSSAPLYYKEWVDQYTRLYGLLSAALFPSYTEVSSFFVDREQPPVVVIFGAAIPVIEALASLIAPYVVMRQGAAAASASAAEIGNVVQIVLNELEAGDLPGDVYTRLRNDGSLTLRALLTTQIRQFSLLPSKRDLFTQTAPAPIMAVTYPGTGSLPPLPPDSLPR
jgi:hypothetical protein